MAICQRRRRSSAGIPYDRKSTSISGRAAAEQHYMDEKKIMTS